MEHYIKLKDARQVLGISQPTFYKLLEQNILPYVKTGNKFRVNRADVESLSRTGWEWNASTTV